jgi:hypothetical protein
MRRRQGWVRGFAAISMLLVSGACQVLSTDLLLNEFNTGITDSMPDPALTPQQIATERVQLAMRGPLIRGYFRQGAQTDGVADWLEDPEVEALFWEHLTRRIERRCDGGAPELVIASGPVINRTAARPSCPTTFRSRLVKLVLTKMPTQPELCEAGKPSDAAKRFSDATRLAAALDLASLEITRLVVEEQVVSPDQARCGVHEAITEAASYLRARRWQPSMRAPTFGVAIKGGASSGMFSAGAVWRMLTMIQKYQEWKASQPFDIHGVDPADAHLTVASGTSAGAVIAAAVDLFHQKTCVIDPEATKIRGKLGMKPKDIYATGVNCQEYARRVLATLFTCTDQSNLYCKETGKIWSLLDDQQGLMDFDKLRSLLLRHIGPNALTNPMELVLTTVDFRYGNLYVQSDQDPSTVTPTPPGATPSSTAVLDVHRSIEASFVLPFIALPVDRLRIHGKDDVMGVYLDGGIKSEVPLLALMQRGVERAVMIGSGPPQITPTPPQKNAIDIAMRYLDVSLSAVTEAEWRASIPITRYVEAVETAACMESLPAGFTEASAKAFCGGNLSEACDDRQKYRQENASTGDPEIGGRRFEVLGIFRQEHIDPTFGYSFDPVQMKRLFMAGAEASRERCHELGAFLGMGDAPAELRADWCALAPIEEPDLCSRGERKPVSDCEGERNPK